MTTRFPPLAGPLQKKRGGPLHTLKKWPLFCPPPNFRGEPKKVGHTHSTKCHVLAVFFFPQLKNSAHEKFFCPFFRFFYKRKPFSRPLLGQMFIFCTPTFVFHGYFLVIFWIFSLGTNEFSQPETVCLQGDFV